MKLYHKLFLFLCALLFATTINQAFAANDLKITRIATRDEDLIIYWERLLNMDGYNVKTLDKQDNIIDTLYIEKNYNFATIESFIDKGVRKIEIVGVNEDSSTKTVGYKLNLIQNHPIDINRVILGAYEDGNKIYLVYNPSLNIVSSRIYIDKKSYDVKDGYIEIKNLKPGEYTLLAEVKLTNGDTLWGTYTGETVDIEKYKPQTTECIFKDRKIYDEDNIQYLEYELNSQDTLKISLYDISGNILITKQTQDYKIELPENAVMAELAIDDEHIMDNLKKNGEIVPFGISDEHVKSHTQNPSLEVSSNYKATKEVDVPYDRINLTLGSQTLADVTIGDKIVYKGLTSNDLNELCLPLQAGANIVSIIAYTEEGTTATKSTIITYTPQSTGIDNLLKGDASIKFNTNFNGQTVQKDNIVFSGNVTGGDILTVNGWPVNLDIYLNFNFKANLSPGNNQFVFSVTSDNGSNYTETVNITYVVPDLITSVDSLEMKTEQYKELPDKFPEKPIETPPPTYDEILVKEEKIEDNVSTWVIFISLMSAIFIGLHLYKKRNKKK